MTVEQHAIDEVVRRTTRLQERMKVEGEKIQREKSEEKERDDIKRIAERIRDEGA